MNEIMKEKRKKQTKKKRRNKRMKEKRKKQTDKERKTVRYINKQINRWTELRMDRWSDV
jgi:hypothetical protein